MEQPHVLYEVEDHVATITLNRPEARNAFTPEMIRLWRESYERARADDEVRVVVVTGRGDTFCSGGNLRDMADGKLVAWDMKRFLRDGVHRVALALRDLDKPVLAAINGAAMGAGLDMALMCDLRVCSDRAKLAETYILFGLVPGDGGAYFLPRLVGLAKALELLLTGDPVTPERPAPGAGEPGRPPRPADGGDDEAGSPHRVPPFAGGPDDQAGGLRRPDEHAVGAPGHDLLAPRPALRDGGAPRGRTGLPGEGRERRGRRGRRSD